MKRKCATSSTGSSGSSVRRGEKSLPNYRMQRTKLLRLPDRADDELAAGSMVLLHHLLARKRTAPDDANRPR